MCLRPWYRFFVRLLEYYLTRRSVIAFLIVAVSVLSLLLANIWLKRSMRGWRNCCYVSCIHSIRLSNEAPSSSWPINNVSLAFLCWIRFLSLSSMKLKRLILSIKIIAIIPFFFISHLLSQQSKIDIFCYCWFCIYIPIHSCSIWSWRILDAEKEISLVLV